MKYCVLVFGAALAYSVAMSAEAPSVETLNYRTYELDINAPESNRYKQKWHEVRVSELRPFCDPDTKGVLVEIPMGHTGLHPVSAILVPYDKFKNNKSYDLAVYNESKNIALIAFRRWNTSCLSLGCPDSDEILRKHGFKYSSLDVCRMLRLMCDE